VATKTEKSSYAVDDKTILKKIKQCMNMVSLVDLALQLALCFSFGLISWKNSCKNEILDQFFISISATNDIYSIIDVIKDS